MADSSIGRRAAPPINPLNPTGYNRPVTVFELTVWAYRTQMVRYEVDRHPEFLPGKWRGNLIDELLGIRRSLEGRGSINGAGTSADVAAHVIHAHVRRLSGEAQHQVITCAEKAAPPNWNPYIAPFRLIPDWKGQPGRLERVEGALVARGKFRKIWGNKNRWIGCWLRGEGTPPGIAAAIRDEARHRYRIWYEGLAKLEPILKIDPRLTDFRVSGVGASAEPWE